MNERLVSFLSLFVCTALQAQDLQLESRQIRAGEHVYSARLGHIPMPQRHEDPEAGMIKLAVCVLESTAELPGPPVFFLNGIPGAATAQSRSPRWAPFLELGDVVLVDQRGCGQSQPALVWEREVAAEKLFGPREMAEAEAVRLASAVREYVAEKGLDLGAFNTRESARDIDAVREVLGYESMILIGHSGGSHLGFEILRQFGDRVEQFVSLGTAGPDDIHSLPAKLDESLRNLSALVAADERIGEEMPDFYARVEKVLTSLEEQPIEILVSHPETGDRVDLLLGKQGMQFILLLDMGDPADFIVFPRMVHEFEQGKTEVLSWFVQRRYAQMSAWPALLFINRGMSGASEARWQRIRAEAPDSVFGMVRCNFSPAIDAAFGIEYLGEDFNRPVESEVPVLFISGTLDANTPPFRAEQARQHLSNSAHVIIANAGHDDVASHQLVHDSIHRFLREGEIKDALLTLPMPRFALLEGKDALVRHPALAR